MEIKYDGTSHYLQDFTSTSLIKKLRDIKSENRQYDGHFDLISENKDELYMVMKLVNNCLEEEIEQFFQKPIEKFKKDMYFSEATTININKGKEGSKMSISLKNIGTINLLKSKNWLLGRK